MTTERHPSWNMMVDAVVLNTSCCRQEAGMKMPLELKEHFGRLQRFYLRNE